MMRKAYLLPLLAVLMFSACSRQNILLVDRTGMNVNVENMGEAVNSSYDDFAPSVSHNGDTLLFTTNRPARDGDELDAVYKSCYDGAAWMPALAFDVTGGANIKSGSIATDADGHSIIYVQCFREDGIGDCDLYLAETKNGQWAASRNAGPSLNSVEWDCHPTLTADGRTLVFASERRGGHGGSDLWMSHKGNDGVWSVPVNLGEPINTSGDEKAPHISADGNTLYFSSDAHPGYGEYDVFQSVKNAKGWGQPMNCGKPINSAYDDLFYCPSVTGDTAYLASNRPGGRGRLDIYRMIQNKRPVPKEEPKPIVRYLTKNAFTLEPIPAELTINEGDRQAVTLKASESGMVEQTGTPGASYSVRAQCEGYVESRTEYSLPDNAKGVREVEILLTPIQEKERIIYHFIVEFDFDLSNIRESERHNLDSVVTLLTRYPNCTVVVTGHTDSVGTEEYNIRLGRDRAERVGSYVERYLKSKGVKLQNGMDIRTFGETQPIATNSTDEGRQRNRRVEISVVRNE